MNSQTDFFENRISPNPLAIQMVNSIKGFEEIKYFGDNFFPTHLIFFDEKLDVPHIMHFIRKMKIEDLKGYDKYSQKLAFRRVAIEMCDPNNLIRLFVSNCYSSDKLPGYMTIPYNFEFKDLINYYKENKNEILRLKERVSVKLKKFMDRLWRKVKRYKI